MTQLDFTKQLNKKKNARVCYITIYKNNNMYGMSSSVGIGFVKWIKRRGHLQKTVNKRIKWWSGNSNSISKAVTKARNWYGINLASSGWTKYKVKVWNFSDLNDIIEILKDDKTT
tara:strand:- start:1886 stop:2230 length:345 start_codon:yes stop_codon:yes gene_type:complete